MSLKNIKAEETPTSLNVTVRKIENGYLVELDFSMRVIYFETIHAVANWFVAKGIEPPTKE